MSARRIIVALALVAGASTTFVAQAAGGRLEEIVVTATRVDKERLRAPMAISVVGAEDIRDTQQLGLDEALNQVPGVFFQNRHNFAQDLRVSIRGFGARAAFGIRGVKIFVDGIPSTTTDGQGGVDDIDLGSVERVEVIRGPSAALYGSAAGGVISLVTEDGPPEPFVQLGLAVGEFDYQKYQLKTGGQAGPLNYLINASYLNLEGYRQRAWVQHGQVNSKFRYDFGDDSDLTVIVNAVDSPRADDPGGLRAADVAVNRKQAFCGLNAFNDACRFKAGETLEQQKVGFVYRKPFGANHEVVVRNYYVWRDFGNRLPFQSSAIVEFDRFFLGGGAQYIWTGTLFGLPNRFTAGFDIESQEDDRRRFDNLNGEKGPLVFDQIEQADAQGVFFQNELALTDSVELTFGGRYDMIDLEVDDRFLANGDQTAELDFDEFSPMVGLQWSPRPEINLYANFSTAFETPTFTELANPAQEGTLGGFAGVTSQNAENYEIGVKGIVGGRVSYEFVAFTAEVDDEITNVFNDGSRAFFQNADTERNGIEAALTVNVFDGLDVTAAYTYSAFEFERFPDNPAAEGNELPGIPEHQFYAVVTYRHPSGLRVKWDMLHVGSFFADNGNTVKNDAYQVSNLFVARTFAYDRLSIEPYAGVNNVFDEDYIGNVRINAFGGRFFEPAPDKHFFAGVNLRYDF